MTQFVRAKDPGSGHEFTTSAQHAKNAGLEVLKNKDAVDRDGRPLPAKHNTDKAGKPVASKEA